MGDMADQALERGLCDNYEFRDHVDDLDKYDNVEEHDYVGEGNEIKKVDFEFLSRESNKAWLIRFSNNRQSWFPKSRCVVDYKNKTILVPKWLVGRKAESEGLKLEEYYVS